jgi:hypothetical protein
MLAGGVGLLHLYGHAYGHQATTAWQCAAAVTTLGQAQLLRAGRALTAVSSMSSAYRAPSD